MMVAPVFAFASIGDRAAQSCFDPVLAVVTAARRCMPESVSIRVEIGGPDNSTPVGRQRDFTLLMAGILLLRHDLGRIGSVIC